MTYPSLLAFVFFILQVVIEGRTVTTLWESATPLPAQGRHHPITFANETHAFLLTGTTPSNPANNDFYMYDEANDQWTNLTGTSSAFPGVGRSLGYGVILNEARHPKAYLGLGVGSDGQTLSDWWEFDMSTHVWTRLADFAGLGRRHPAMNAVRMLSPSTSTASWEIHVGLGDDATKNFNDWWSYSISDDTWEALPAFPGTPVHHPFYFALGSQSYAGMGHSDTNIEKDWYRFENGSWFQELDFASYTDSNDGSSEKVLVTMEARVAGTQFVIELPLFQSGSLEVERSNDLDNATNVDELTTSLSGSLGFVLSGDGDDHGSMDTGEFHVFHPGRPSDSSPGYWWALPPHPGKSRWAPGSFVMRGTARVFFTGGLDQSDGTLHNDLWTIDLSELFLPAEDDVDESAVADVPSSPPAAMTSSCNILGMKLLALSSMVVLVASGSI